MEQRNRYAAEVRDVFSGDDLVLWVELGTEDLYMRKRIRLNGVQVPNAVGQGPTTEAGKIRAQVYDMLKKQKLFITITARAPHSWVAVVEIDTHNGIVNLNNWLISQGYEFNRNKGNQ